jgi:hypothetical protein
MTQHGWALVDGCFACFAAHTKNIRLPLTLTEVKYLLADCESRQFRNRDPNATFDFHRSEIMEIVR